ncbi:hypothetical protein NVP1238A_16 [Vibrio phage 1.238.A._10N.261.52.F10]|uniref:Winged helix-turn-helix DNA-binding domain protein n=1 Tax=Vibrio phage 1.238.A._10N.261.52.F10 TaxID=1881231 RepID=A0A2I7RUD0_9CAUD|nr:HNH endonuclease [Vibrio phage 1.238.A._10N.261.52.F10]AUR97265.1 hypothetical protein NVP1238A_16 [Vibrio phage 1.238.A._10N.261.52.F10]AUR97359.1 hypothetical protein NVP1238B_17 [Vibrio phage 1.238.B._10N.261.52.F10]
MPRKPKDITGNVYTRLTALSDTGRKTYGQVWLFRCECGTVKEIVKSEVTGGKIRSCGCLPNGGRFKKTHGGTHDYTYVSWRSMLDRCYRESAENYPIYGGKGITVCPQWRSSYETFLADMGERPQGFTIDRIDGAKGYYPDNCRWASAITQANNTTKNVHLTLGSVTRTIREWADETGLPLTALRCRLNNGWTVEEVLTTPRYKHRGHTKRYEDKS